ncbi:MAG: HAD hydrolase-like protein [Sphingomonas sp.]|nr:HAD hydrolase-like protein [Sphingomonas sp.]
MSRAGSHPVSGDRDAIAYPAAQGGGHRYQLVLFDFDGTLADSGDWFLSKADELAERFKFRKINPDEIETLRGQTSRAVIKSLGIPRWKLPAIAKYLHAQLGKQAHMIALFDGVPAMIDTLYAAGIRLALVTSNSETNARKILGPEIAARISHFECGASLFGKARLFRRVLKRSKIPIDQAICIGDETRDMAAAAKVGVTAGAVLWGYANKDALSACNPHYFFTDPAEVLAHILDEVRVTA